MSCQNCEEQKGVAYYRLGKANIGIIGCDEHLREAFGLLNGTDYSDRVIHRVI